MSRIVHILKDLDVGGIQTVLLDRLQHAAENQQDESLVCLGSGAMKKDFDAFNTTFLPKKLPWLDPFAVWKLRQHLLRINPTEVHAHHTSEGVTAWLATRGTGIKYIQYFHVHPNVCNRQDNLALKMLAKLADAGISPTRAQREALTQAGYSTKKIAVVHNKVHSRRLNPNGDNLRQKLGIPKNTRLLLSTGNFYNTTRDQETICKAMAEVLPVYPDVHIVFAGGITNRYTPKSESYEACMRICRSAEILDRVHFPGVLPNAPGYLSQCDLFVYATLGDTFGMAVVEAMLSGTAVIANDHPVMREVTGGVVPLFTSADALAQAVKNHLDNPAEYPQKAVSDWAKQFLW
ncbi:MAG: glycosyltransferase family 4 protein [Cryomorphaceae bacterium]|nr:glycosyltransferase family 4 protein [Cryomorphaceae bacterium]